MLRSLALAALAALLLAAPVARAAEPHPKEVVQNFYKDVFIGKDADAASRYLKSDFVQHNPRIPGGLDGFRTFFRDAFKEQPADLKIELLHVIAEGDLVAVHTRFSGTAPDHTHFEVPGFDLYRVKDGKIAEHWDAVAPE
jgi:predicted SnoaL-like aldol condensation-catalyzing enzyme